MTPQGPSKETKDTEVQVKVSMLVCAGMGLSGKNIVFILRYPQWTETYASSAGGKFIF